MHKRRQGIGRLTAGSKRIRFGKFGAWYDSRRTVKTDSHGDAVDPWIELKKGTKYVIYFWGGSRDDLKPDKRLEFEYTGKGVDLGVIVLPGYPDK